MMHEDSAFEESHLKASPEQIANYPRNVFGTLVWLRREDEALGLAALIEKPIVRAETLCTVAKHLRERGDVEKHRVLSILARAQETLALPDKREKKDPPHDRVQKLLVLELVCWQQWPLAWQLADAIPDSYRNEAFSAIFRQKLQEGQWEEARAAAHAAGGGGQGWMLRSLCEALAIKRMWDDAEEIARSIKHPDGKVKALSALARELAAASSVERARGLWREAIQATLEEGVSVWTFDALSEALARASEWELAESVARALTFPLPGADAQAKQAGRIRDRQAYDRIEALSILVARAEALATLATEIRKAQAWTRAGALWDEAYRLASSCESTWTRTVALGHLTLCLAEAKLWKRAFATWEEAEAIWKKERTRSYDQESEEFFHAYDDEEHERRLRVLVPFSRLLVNAGRWEQAWRLCSELEEASIQIRLGRVIAEALEQRQQSEDARIVWKRISEIACATAMWAHDLARLALALQQAQQWNEADAVWKASVQSQLEADQDNPWHRTINCGSLALKLAQAGRREEAALLLNECIRAAAEIRDSDAM